MIAVARARWRLYRLEVLLLGVVIAAAVGFAFAIVVALAGHPRPPDCALDAAPQSSGCPSAAAFFELSHGPAAALATVIGTLPFVVGSVLGVPIVAREIEHRTASFSWTMQPARWRWLIEQVALLGALTVTLLVPVVIASLSLQGARFPGIDPGRSFFDYGASGPILLVRGVAIFSIAILAGATIGRVLPALLVAIVASAILYGTLPAVAVAGRPLEIVTEEAVNRGALYVTQGYLADDGRLLTPREAFALAPPGLPPGDSTDWIETHFRFTRLGLPGERLGGVLAQEATVLAGLTALCLGSSSIVVRRRRPY